MKPVRAMAVLVLTLSAAVVASCGSPSARTTSTETSNSAGLSAFDPAGYFDLLGGRISLQAVDPNAPASEVSPQEWTSLITKERAVGLRGLTQSEREILLSGAMTAYLTLVRSARFEINIAGSDKTASVTEVYSAARSPDHSTLFDVQQRRVTGEGISAKWGDVPTRSNDAPDDTRIFNEFAPNERIRTLYWTHTNAGWQCRSGDQTGEFSLLAFGRIALIDTVITAPVGEEIIVRGRRAISYAPITTARRSTRIIVDEETLWPIMYEYLDASGATISSSVLTSVNMNESLPIPGDESECTGQ